MSRFLKTFLLWLLIAAMPIQGIAAVVKASCGPQHHDMPSMMVKIAEHHHDSGSAVHDHGMDGMHPVLADIDSANSAADDSSSSGQIHKTSYCSACAACCVGAVAPPSTASLAPMFSSIEAAVLPSVTSFTGFIPAGLERPPRPFSA